MKRMAKNIGKGLVIAPETSAFEWKVLWTERLAHPMGTICLHCQALGFDEVTRTFSFAPNDRVRIAR